MALTPTQQEWLENDNLRVILVEAVYSLGSDTILCNSTAYDCNSSSIYCNTTGIEIGKELLYLSNFPFITDFGGSFTNVLGDSVQDIGYDDVVETIPNIISKIDASSTIGNIVFLNTTGEYDTFIDNPWEGQVIRILMGDPSWARVDFITAFDGIIDAVTAPSISTVSIAVRDKKDILNKSNEGAKITNDIVTRIINSATEFTSGINDFPRLDLDPPLDPLDYDPTTIAIPEGVENTKVPICIGQCFNIEPILIDAWNHVYLIHDGEITSVSNVKSNGVDLKPDDPGKQYEVDTGIGCIRLLDHAQSSKITCDVVGAANRGTGYDTAPGNALTKDTAPWVIEWLVLEKTPLIKTDIDYDTFTAITDNYPVGVFIKDDFNIADIMTLVMTSIGGFYRFSRTSELQLTILKAPADAGTPVATIDPDSLYHNGLSLSAIEVPRHQISVGFKKNWTILSKEEQAGILQEQEGLQKQQTLASPYSTLTKVIPAVKTTYPLAETYDTIETVLYVEADAQAELDRRAVIRAEKRYIYKLESVTPPLNLSVGDPITIENTRFGFDTGEPAVVISLSERITSNRVDIEAWL